MTLQHKTAIVTGGSRGIGRAICLQLAQQGANVVINYSGNEQKAREVAEQVEALGVKALVIQTNVADVNQVDQMIKQTLETFGSIDILVNNAGITRDNLLMRMKEAEWDDVMDTNLKGVFLCTKAVTRQMMKQRAGRIINISSIVGVSGNAGQANYVAAKAGVIGFTKTVAQELASRNVLVNAVAPGFITTEMTDALPEDVKEAMLKQIPLARLGQPEDVAKTVAFFASDAANYITGQVIHVDGGLVMA